MQKHNPLRLGLEIGGTKLQVGVGTADGRLLTPLVRRTVVQAEGAEGIRRALAGMVTEALASAGQTLAQVEQVGIGFGGVLDAQRGVTRKSFQIDGWDEFPLKAWAEAQWGRPVVMENDASVAGLAEALHGAGRGYRRVFYMTIGSGIGGGWVVDGRVDGGQGLGAAELGHTWVTDPRSGKPIELEQFASGWGIGQRARRAAESAPTQLTRLAGSVTDIDARTVHAAAGQGDAVAQTILAETCEALGCAIANVIALLHPQRVVIGGGVSLMGPLFWDGLRAAVGARAMPLFLPGVDVVPAELGEKVVVIGALCL